MKNQKGISLVESLLAIAIIGSIVFLIANIPNSLLLVSKSRHLSLAREIAAKQIEDKRSTSYININLGNMPVVDNRLSALPQGSGETVAGVQDQSGNWVNCDVASVCANGEKLKQVKVTINWIDNNKPQNLVLDTIIAEGGIDQ